MASLWELEYRNVFSITDRQMAFACVDYLVVALAIVRENFSDVRSQVLARASGEQFTFYLFKLQNVNNDSNGSVSVCVCNVAALNDRIIVIINKPIDVTTARGGQRLWHMAVVRWDKSQ